ncbi:MAG: helicase [Cryobacterium sp.]|nr:helicase [Cryobacterium sp.]
MERGAGSILAVALVAAIIACLVLVAPLCSVLVARARATGAADASALAAADAARGILPGIPCRVAASVARENKATLSGCRADGVIVTVKVSVTVFGLPVSARATAGPASSGR